MAIKIIIGIRNWAFWIRLIWESTNTLSKVENTLSTGLSLLNKLPKKLFFKVEENNAGIVNKRKKTNEVVSVFLVDRYNRDIPNIKVISPNIINVPSSKVYSRNGNTSPLPREDTIM